MLNSLLITSGKLLSKTVHMLNLGNGSTWPGHIALKINKSFTKDILKKNPHLKIIIIAGTNGKTTTTKMIKTILEENKKMVLENTSGANLLNGIASTLLLHATPSGKLPYDYALFEIDENILPKILNDITPDYLLLLNLFRDQLDRYGEVRSVAQKWKTCIQTLSDKTTLIVNADDPEIAYLGYEAKNTVFYFGLQKAVSREQHEHAVDSVYCPQCGNKLAYKKIFYSHLGEWQCTKCNLQRPVISYSEAPDYPLSGMYNSYNTLAAGLLANAEGLSELAIKKGLEVFVPAFGRQETITYKEKTIQLFLAKNPTGFNESIRTIMQLQAKTVVLLLNDRYADGIDISWIWDIDTEDLTRDVPRIVISGDRAEDMGLRIKYSLNSPIKPPYVIEPDLETAIAKAVEMTSKEETLFILPTYTAMLETRQILTGKKIL